ncbi:P-loop containing nucleoside triphosphate hydrolase protein [Auricularia subglabra TFB-10046 SS5]|nr:P-loop containing nucleoside triphosphate hydrolase protein [Auricularia subglabra TFB-10046 SS5]
MDSVKNILTPFGFTSNAIQDTLKLVVIGGTVETVRRVSSSAWSNFVDSFFLTAHFSQEDYPYDWIMHWLSKQPAWARSREFEITTRSAGRNALQSSTAGDIDEAEEDEDEDDVLVHGRRRRKVALMPSVDTTHTIYYKGHWLRITRSKRTDGWNGSYQQLTISVVARNNSILKSLVLEAKKEYEKDAEHRVHIFMADVYGSWRWNGARQKRPMSSIVLEPGVKEMLINDCKDFLRSEDWYAERGIPFRRGYLLHGVPGSGKTSLIHSLAGELGLDIYVVSLSSKGMSDNTLNSLMGRVPSRCILLLEDLDAAFTRGVSRDATSTGAPPGGAASGTTKTTTETTESDGSTLSLSGLLNSLDGVAAAEGRLLFATTNHIERLDPALSRPGRMDVWVNFTNATKWQAEGIFKCFFPSAKARAENQARRTASEQHLPGHPRRAPSTSTHRAPLLSDVEIAELAKQFADAIPEGEMSVASLQGYLLKNKTRPRECVAEAAEWVTKERETKAKLKKEKEEKEKKEKEETEAKEKKEKEEAEAKKKLEEEEARKKAKKERKEKKKAKKAESSSSSSDSSDSEADKKKEKKSSKWEKVEKPAEATADATTSESPATATTTEAEGTLASPPPTPSSEPAEAVDVSLIPPPPVLIPVPEGEIPVLPEPAPAPAPESTGLSTTTATTIEVA